MPSPVRDDLAEMTLGTGNRRPDILASVDTDPLPDERADALRHDVKALEYDAEQAAERAAGYVVKRVAAVLVGMLVITWLVPRKRASPPRLPLIVNCRLRSRL